VLSRKKGDDVQAAKIKIIACLKMIKNYNNIPWFDLLAVTVLPEGVTRLSCLPKAWKIGEKYLNYTIPDGNDYTPKWPEFLLTAYAKYSYGGKYWSKFHPRFSKFLLSMQKENGSFKSSKDLNEIDTTSLGLMVFGLYYHSGKEFLDNMYGNGQK
jgi:hypothetical protein